MSVTPPKDRLFTGFQPTGELHLGNYIGAIAPAVGMIPQYDCFFCIVDYHGITVEYDPAELPERTRKAAAMLLACGMTPDRCVLFRQSDVPEHTELAWVLNSVAPMGELERMTQYKDKSQQHAANLNAGLFTYPVLQAADILLYKGKVVPVGEDQAQHLELCREIARRFNRRYGPIFPEPKTLLTQTPRIMGIDGKKKMSKTLNNTIGLAEEPAEAWKKLAAAVTDENRKRRSDPGNPDVCNIFTMHGHFTSAEKRSELDRGCRTAGIGCVDCKKVLAEGMERELGPIRRRYAELLAQPEAIDRALEAGAERCRSVAKETMKEVRRAMGFHA